MQGTEFQFLVTELRSHMLHDTAKKKKKITNLEKNLENNKYAESLWCKPTTYTFKSNHALIKMNVMTLKKKKNS